MRHLIVNTDIFNYEIFPVLSNNDKLTIMLLSKKIRNKLLKLYSNYKFKNNMTNAKIFNNLSKNTTQYVTKILNVENLDEKIIDKISEHSSVSTLKFHYNFNQIINISHNFNKLFTITDITFDNDFDQSIDGLSNFINL